MSESDIPSRANSSGDQRQPVDTRVFDDSDLGRIAASVTQRFSIESFSAPPQAASPAVPMKPRDSETQTPMPIATPNNFAPFSSSGYPGLDRIYGLTPPAASSDGVQLQAAQSRLDSLADHSAEAPVNLDGNRRALVAYFNDTDVTHKYYVNRWMQQAEEKLATGELNTQELGHTYAQVNRLLHTDSPYLTKEQRTNIGAEILFHLSTPRTDQGLHGTCNVTVLENIAFDKHPSLAAKIITDAALTATFTDKDGKQIQLPPESLQPGFEEELTFPPPDMFRTHASQLFQVAILNDVGQHDKVEPRQFVQKPEGLGSFFFKMGELLPFAEYWMPNGYEVWKHAGGKETAFQGLYPAQIADESKRLFGNRYEVLDYESPYEKYSHPFLSGENSSNPLYGWGDSKRMQSEDMLRQNLTRLNGQNRLPVIVGVNGYNSNIMRSTGTLDTVIGGLFSMIRPIKTIHDYIDTKIGIANHVVTVKRYDPASDKVFVSNSWGKDQDGWLSVKDLWNAM